MCLKKQSHFLSMALKQLLCLSPRSRNFLSADFLEFKTRSTDLFGSRESREWVDSLDWTQKFNL